MYTGMTKMPVSITGDIKTVSDLKKNTVAPATSTFLFKDEVGDLL